jgi:hypothetical protein
MDLERNNIYMHSASILTANFPLSENDFEKRISCLQNRGDLQQTTPSAGEIDEANRDSGYEGRTTCRRRRRG